MVDYMYELRQGILEAYAGIITGLGTRIDDNTPSQLEAFKPFVPQILRLIATISEDRERPDGLLGCACGLVG